MRRKRLWISKSNLIDLFKKLKRENHIRLPGIILDLGCGNASKDQLFIDAGYSMVLVDRNSKALEQARERIGDESKITFVESAMESFNFSDLYDGIIAQNSLPFMNDKTMISTIVNKAYDHLNPGGFLYFTLFGPEDAWAKDDSVRLVFFTPEEARTILSHEPYFVSEDKGIGSKMDGSTKWWHILHFLYIKS